MNYAKFSNIYKDGKVISKKDKWGRNRVYTTEEVEQLIDELAENKDENGKIKDPQALNNANAILFQMYQKYGNPHEKEILEAIKRAQETKSLEEQKKDALEEISEELKEANEQKDDEYVEFEEVKDELKETNDNTIPTMEMSYKLAS